MGEVSRETRVIKVGGSVLCHPDLPKWLRAFVGNNPCPVTYWVAGGGALVDVIRDWDRRLQLGEDASYALTLTCLNATAHLLQQILNRAGLNSCWWNFPDVGREQRGTLGEPDKLNTGAEGHRVVDLSFCVRRFPEEWSHEYKLATWEATSDTMAALVARFCAAQELVLVKACPIDARVRHSLVRAAELGIVDRRFPSAADGLARVQLASLADA